MQSLTEPVEGRGWNVPGTDINPLWLEQEEQE